MWYLYKENKLKYSLQFLLKLKIIKLQMHTIWKNQWLKYCRRGVCAIFGSIKLNYIIYILNNTYGIRYNIYHVSHCDICISISVKWFTRLERWTNVFKISKYLGLPRSILEPTPDIYIWLFDLTLLCG